MYSDLNQTFTKDKNLLTSDSYQAINNSINNILFTARGERVGDPEFGSNLIEFLFEPVDYYVSYLIADRILDNIEFYEPRIFIDEILISPEPDNNTYNVNIKYTIIKTNTEYTYVNVLRRL